MGHSINPTTGALTFNNTPSTVSDLQAAADRAEEIGSAWVATVTDLEDVEYPREGETRRVRADGSYWGFDGSGWENLANVQVDTDGAIPDGTVPVMKAGAVSVAFVSGSGNLVFPTPFTTACIMLQVTGQYGVGFPMNILSAPTKTGCSVANTTGTTATTPVHYLAIGY